MLRLDVKTTFAVDEEGVIEGLASVFATADRGGDVVHKGAFAKAAFPIPMLASHDPADVIGVWEEGRETAEGLRVKGRLILTVQRAREVRDLILAKAIEGLSIGYVATRKAARKGGGRDLLAVDLCEISVVAVPMHPGARITSAKSADQKGEETVTLEELRAMLAEIGADPSTLETKAAGAAAPAVTAALAPVLERMDAMEAKANRPGNGATETAELSAERKGFQAYLKFGDRAPEAELKALSMVSDGQGGYLAPPEFSAEIIKDLVEFSPIRSVASVRGTTAPSVIYPTRKPFGNATWDDELDDETQTADADFMGQTELTLRGMSTFVDVNNVLLQDAPQVETEVRAAVTEDYAKKESIGFVKGNGVGQPEGVMVNTKIAISKNGHATVIQPDALINLLYAQPATYRNAGVWAMNGSTLAAVRKLKDGQNNYLWQPSYQAGQPETILGRPVLEVLDMDDIAANAFPIIYGDFSGYRIVDRQALTFLVDPYTRAVNKQTRYHSTRRLGGRVLMPAKFRKLKMEV